MQRLIDLGEIEKLCEKIFAAYFVFEFKQFREKYLGDDFQMKHRNSLNTVFSFPRLVLAVTHPLLGHRRNTLDRPETLLARSREEVFLESRREIKSTPGRWQSSFR